MNKFAFQNNARQSHLPGRHQLVATHSVPRPPTDPLAHSPTHPLLPIRNPSIQHFFSSQHFFLFHSVLSIDQVLNFRVHPSRA
ncbi:GSCOCG00005051001-RA-CDS, partial [Cotesia congregata]